MDIRSRFALLALLFASLLPGARAQSTDGYHAIQVFPVVVDTASFVQRFHFRAASPWEPFQVLVRYYPAQGTAQATPLDCPPVPLSVFGATRYASLRELCPGLPAGSAFGTLVVRAEFTQVFAAYSRVSNMAGGGFSVEAFPANSFTAAHSAVTGLRRKAASGASPAFQTNCFVGSLAELAPVAPPVNTLVVLKLVSDTGGTLGQMPVDVKPGQLVRVLDVFAAAGAPAGDHDDVTATFTTYTNEAPALLTFCTVQDNTSFGADFRIGKQELGFGGEITGAQDWSAMRGSYAVEEEPVDNEAAGARLAIPPGATRNVHLFYFRHPDLLTCALFPESGGSFATPGYGLELRVRVQDGDGSWRVIAGGNNVTFFDSVYLGDKARQGYGANTSYQVEVESNGQNEGANRPYSLLCFAGSGSTKGELLRKGLLTAF